MLLRGRRRAPLGSSGSDGGARGEIKNCFEYRCSFVYVRICWSLPMDISGFRAGSDFHKFEIWLHWSLFCQLFLLDTNGILASLLKDLPQSGIVRETCWCQVFLCPLLCQLWSKTEKKYFKLILTSMSGFKKKVTGTLIFPKMSKITSQRISKFTFLCVWCVYL